MTTRTLYLLGISLGTESAVESVWSKGTFSDIPLAARISRDMATIPPFTSTAYTFSAPERTASILY